jgi:GT2 family glycosyltransferase
MFSIIIPNYNGLEHLETLFDSIKKQTLKNFDIILVDNGSSDNSVNYTKSQFVNSHIIQLDCNTGFANAINEGIIYSLSNTKNEFILLLNNDIELAQNFIEIAANTFKEKPDISIIAVKMLNYYNRKLIDDCGDFIKSNGGSPLARGHNEIDSGQYDKEEYIFGACAGAAFYKTELFKKIGLFDKSFFAYYEDIDFSFRAQLSGNKCYYQPKAVCYHKRGGTSSVATHGFQTKMCERNLVIMRFKNYPVSIYLLYQPLFFIARVKRYYSFIKYHSFSIFMCALNGYIRGLLLLILKYPERYKIQKSKKVSVKYIKSLFIN